MKKIILTVVVLMALVIGTQAQPVKKVERINEEEVPALVRQAFVNDFGTIPDAGTWTVNFFVIHEGAKLSAQPTAYTFRKGNKHDRIEVRYSPDGRLDSVKGLKKG